MCFALLSKFNKQGRGKCNEMVTWIDINQEAGQNEYENKKKEIETMMKTLISELCPDACGTPSAGLIE